MNRNKEIDKLFYRFINDLMILFKESRVISLEKSQDISQIQEELDEKLFNKEKSVGEYLKEGVDSIEFTENPIPLFNKRNDLRRSKKMSLNGNFLYALALFENFASKLIKISTKNEGEYRDRYFEKFKKFAQLQSENKNHAFTDMFFEPQKMIDNYDELPNPLDIWLYVLDINKKGIFNIYKPGYIELRERRNLLIHRGTIKDERYEKSFLKANMGSDKGKKAKKFLDSIINLHSFKSYDDIDLSVSIGYLFHVFETLLAISFLLYINSFKTPKKDDSEIMPNGLLHELMIFAHEISRPPFFRCLESLIKEYMNTMGVKNIESIPGYDMLNMIIWRGYLIDYFKDKSEFYSKKNNNEMSKFFKAEEEDSKVRLSSLRLKIKKTFNQKYKKELELINSHLDGDINELIKIIKNHKIKIEDLESWFIFNKYHKNEQFIQFKNEYKNSNDTSKFKVGVKKG